MYSAHVLTKNKQFYNNKKKYVNLTAELQRVQQSTMNSLVSLYRYTISFSSHRVQIWFR